MLEKTSQLKQEFIQKLSKAQSSADGEALRVEFLGKKGSVSLLMGELKSVPNEQKKEAGQIINDLKKFINDEIVNLQKVLEQKEEQMMIDAAESYDESLPPTDESGSYHPITLVGRELEEIFLSMGFNIEDYVEVVDDYHCFEALNIPKHHPARDMQDTYYLSNGQLLKRR